MIVPYSFDNSRDYYKTYYENQVGNGLSVFRGATTQRGHGIGGFFSGLLKGAMPLIKSGAKTIGKELLNTGVNIAKDAIQGKDFKSSARDNFRSAGGNLFSKLTESLSGKSRQPIRKRKAKARTRSTAKTKRRKTNPGKTSLFKNIQLAAS